MVLDIPVPPAEPPASIETARSRPPREHDGEATHDRFHWQTLVATRRVFELLLAHLTIPGTTRTDDEWTFICEWHEDFCVIHQGQVHLCSVKHRDPTGRRWGEKELIKKGGLLHLFGNWWHLDRTCRTYLYTNSDLLGREARRLKKATELLKPDRRLPLSSEDEKLISQVLETMGRVAVREHYGRGDFALPEELLPSAPTRSPTPLLSRHLRAFLRSLTLVTDLPERQLTHGMLPSDRIRPCLEHLGLATMLTEDAWETVKNMVDRRMRTVGDIGCLDSGTPGFQLLRDPDWRSRPEFQSARRTLSPGQVIDALHKQARKALTGRLRSPQTIAAPRGPFIDNASRTWEHIPWEEGPVLITGGAGMGKTTLAHHYANSSRHSFPHGQVLVDTRGFGPSSPMSTEEIVENLLSQIGEDSRANKATVEDRCLRFRDIIEAHRFMVVLDNVSDAESILPLLPRKQTSAVVVTSRRPLGTLMSHYQAVSIRLEPLPPAEAHELLRALLGEDRVAAELEAANQLLSLCGGVPLAISILAARLNQCPERPLFRFASELADADDRLDLLDLGDARSNMRVVLSWTYTALTPELRDAFILIGACPSPYLDADDTAALLGHSRARKVLYQLQQFGLMTESTDGSFQMHDLLRDYATSLSRESEQAQLLSTQGNERLMRYYADPSTLKADTYTREDPELWIRHHTNALLAAVTYSASIGLIEEACAIADFLTEHLWMQGRWVDCTSALQLVIDALPSSTPVAKASHFLGLMAITLRRMGLYQKALEYAERSLVTLGSESETWAAAESHYTLAVVYSYDEQHELAIPAYQKALRGFREHKDTSSVGDTLNGLGWSISENGDPEGGLPYCLQALEIHRTLRKINSEAADLDSIAVIQHQLGDHESALEHYRLCLSIYRDINHRSNEARTLESMGDVLSDANRPHAAEESWENACLILSDFDEEGAKTIRKKIQKQRGAREVSP
ncbi:tetratricopeptide repeat protein [Nocardiopsis sp. NPDC006198]|uniref:tetratricopeptide repeat protein n=1 Tax=Nocardiopsis sp. NPDC006198 TaxID=3154472 RepID=UPI0033AE22F6